MNEGLLPLGIATLGAACICLFVSARPWPASPEGKPISAGAYVVDIAQGHIPAASVSPKTVDPSTGQSQQDRQITEIQNGLSAALLIWLATKVASGIAGILSRFIP